MTNEGYEELLEQLHLKLLAGGPATSATRSDNQLDAEIDAETLHRLAEAEECLRLIERVRQADATPPAERPMPGAPSSARPGDTPAAPNGSATIDRFTILRTLGQGGHAIVFLAWDPTTRREIALKTPRADALFSAELRQRFVREGIAAARLSHPHVVKVFEVGRAGPVSFIVSEFCQGRSLAALLADHVPIPVSLAVQWVEQLATGVEHAHRLGVWHRDIKPGNVLLEPDAGAGPRGRAADGWVDLAGLTPKLTDFGLAKIREYTDAMTRTGTLLGTPAYMAPEQVDRKVGPVGPATDIYGLGVLLYEMLTGIPPFRGSSEADVLRQVANEEPPAPRRLRRDLPRDLEAIVLACLDKSPARRYPSAGALAEDLARFRRGEATRVRPASSLRRSWNWARRRPTRSIALALVLLLALVVLGGLTWHREALDRADAAANQLRQDSRAREQQLAETRYASDVRLAYQAWQSRDAMQAKAFLTRQVPTAESATDRRGFFWWRLWSLIHGRPKILGPADGTALTVAFSPDGATLASAGQDGTIRLRNAATGTLEAEMDGHTADVNCIAFSPNGKRLASASDDRTIRIWNCAESRLEKMLLANAAVNSVTFHSGGDNLVAGDEQGEISVWQVSAGTRQDVMHGHTREVNQLAISPDGTRLASAGSDGAIVLWDMKSFALIAALKGHAGSVTSVAFSPDGRQLSSAGVDRTVRLWDVETRRPLGEYRGHTDRVDSVSFVGAELLASAGKDGTLRFWDVTTQRPLWTYLADARRIWGLQADIRHQRVATVGASGGVRVWSTADLIQPDTIPSIAASVAARSCAFSPRGDLFACVRPSGRLGVVDLSSGVQREVESPDAGVVSSIWFSRDNQSISSMSRFGVVREYDLGKRRTQTLCEPLDPSVELVGSVSTSGRRLAMYGLRSKHGLLLRELDRLDAKPRDVPLATFPLDVLFRPDEETLLVLLQGLPLGEASMMLVDWSTGKVRPLPWSKLNDVDAAAFSTDGQYIAYSGGIRQVWVRRWDDPAAEPLVLQAPQQCARLAFAPGEPFLVGIGTEGAVSVWSLIDGEPLLGFDLPEKPFRDVVLQQDGNWLALTLENGLSPEAWLFAAPRGDQPPHINR